MRGDEHPPDVIERMHRLIETAVEGKYKEALAKRTLSYSFRGHGVGNPAKDGAKAASGDASVSLACTAGRPGPGERNPDRMQTCLIGLARR